MFDTVTGVPEVGAVVWSLLFGAVAFVGGITVDALERAAAPIPAPVGWSLLVIAVLGAVLAPISGFWLVLVPAVVIILRSRRRSVQMSG